MIGFLSWIVPLIRILIEIITKNESYIQENDESLFKISILSIIFVLGILTSLNIHFYIPDHKLVYIFLMIQILWETLTIFEN